MIHSAVLALDAAKTVASIFCASQVRKAVGQAGGVAIIKALQRYTQDDVSKDQVPENYSNNKEFILNNSKRFGQSYPDIEKTVNALESIYNKPADSFYVKLCKKAGLLKISSEIKIFNPKVIENIRFTVDRRDGYLVPEDLLWLQVSTPEDYILKMNLVQLFKDTYQLTIEKDSVLLKLDKNKQIVAENLNQDIVLEPILPPEDPKKSDDKDDNKIKINQNPEAILKDGYYEVNGFKFSKYYYEKLWNEGRQGPTLIVQEILKEAKNVLPDSLKLGFMRYEADGWEMIYNPVTKEIWHLVQMKIKNG